MVKKQINANNITQTRFQMVGDIHSMLIYGIPVALGLQR